MTAADLKLRSTLKQRGDYWIVGLSWYDSSGKRKQTNISTGLTIIGNKYRAEAKEREIYKEYERQLLSDTTEADKILFCKRIIPSGDEIDSAFEQIMNIDRRDLPRLLLQCK